MTEPTADEIKLLIENFEASEWKELSLQAGNFSLFLSRDPERTVPGWLKQSAAGAATQAAPAAEPRRPQPEAAAARSAAADNTRAEPDPNPSVPDGAVAIKAPNLGIFYRAPKPGAAPYVNPGDPVEPDTEVCLIEVMKLFTPVTAGISGTVAKVCIEDGEMVDHGQTLFYIQPNS